MILGITAMVTGFFLCFEVIARWEPRLEKIRFFIDKYDKYLGVFSVFVGVWKFFGPDATEVFTGYLSPQGSYMKETVEYFIGDLIPSLLLFVGGFALTPEILNIFNIEETKKEKILALLKQYQIAFGIGNLLFGFLHLLVGKTTFL